MKLILIFLAVLLSFSAFAQSETAYFAFKTGEYDPEFIFQLKDDNKIQTARNILSGDEKNQVHVLGRIIKKQASYNPNFSFYLDPSSIGFFEVAIEVCDATILYVEDHLDEACGAFLPGCIYCPWSSKLTREVKI